VASQVKMLLDELASVLAEMGALEETPNTDEATGEAAPMSEEQEASLRSLEAKADKLRERIAFHERLAAKEAELRAVLEKGAPAKVIKAAEAKEESVENRYFAVPKAHRTLRAFVGQRGGACVPRGDAPQGHYVQ